MSREHVSVLEVRYQDASGKERSQGVSPTEKISFRAWVHRNIIEPGGFVTFEDYGKEIDKDIAIFVPLHRILMVYHVK